MPAIRRLRRRTSNHPYPTRRRFTRATNAVEARGREEERVRDDLIPSWQFLFIVFLLGLRIVVDVVVHHNIARIHSEDAD
ncbi:hypothetical protein PM082_013894 [Marasmius tenuissimus]|nr:hypothetical protein PM082_013894 [Marasmius tenuissimus]